MEECRSVPFQFVRLMCCFWHKVSSTHNLHISFVFVFFYIPFSFYVFLLNLSFPFLQCISANSDQIVGAGILIVWCVLSLSLSLSHSLSFCISMENKSMENLHVLKVNHSISSESYGKMLSISYIDICMYSQRSIVDTLHHTIDFQQSLFLHTFYIQIDIVLGRVRSNQSATTWTMWHNVYE